MGALQAPLKSLNICTPFPPVFFSYLPKKKAIYFDHLGVKLVIFHLLVWDKVFCLEVRGNFAGKV